MTSMEWMKIRPLSRRNNGPVAGSGSLYQTQVKGPTRTTGRSKAWAKLIAQLEEEFPLR